LFWAAKEYAISERGRSWEGEDEDVFREDPFFLHTGWGDVDDVADIMVINKVFR